MAQIWDKDLMIPGQADIGHGVTVFLYGPPGTIKTTWAGSWPNPVFLSAGAEGGDDSLAMLPSILGINPPPVYQISSVQMMKDKVDYICLNYLQYGWKTVVVDSISFYVDLWISERLRGQQALVDIGQKTKPKDGVDVGLRPKDWGDIEQHICKGLAQKLHGTRMNVIWIALAKETYSHGDDAGGGRTLMSVDPLLQGQSSLKLPALCKMIINAEKTFQFDIRTNRSVAVPVYYTTPSSIARLPRHKYGNAFPEGKLIDPEYGTWPTFRAMDSRIGQFIYK